MSNKVYTKEELASQRKKRRVKVKSFGFTRGFVKVLNGEFLVSDFVVSQMPFFLFLAFLAILYIGHGYYVNKLGNDIKKATREINELNAIEVTLKSDYNKISLQSEVSKKVEGIGLQDPVTPPSKIVVEE